MWEPVKRWLRSRCFAWESGRGMPEPLGYVNTYRDKQQHRLHFSPRRRYRKHTLPIFLILIGRITWLEPSWDPVNGSQHAAAAASGERKWLGEPGCLFSKVASGPEELHCVCTAHYWGLLMTQAGSKEVEEWAWMGVLSCEVNSTDEVTARSLKQVNDSPAIKRVCKQTAEHM